MDINTKKQLKTLRTWSLVGLLLSIYATYVELKAEKDASYVALCDVSEKISCTAVFTSIYGRGFGIIQYFFNAADCSWIPPNGVLGIIFYGVLLAFSFRYNKLVSYYIIALALWSNVISFYLAYLLYFVLKNLCFICVAIYIVNHQILKQAWKVHKLHRQANQKLINEQEISNDVEDNENSTDKKQD